MNIIAAHQQGLIEQLEDEVAAIAGRARDYGQRAMVLYHLFDHSRGAHEWALAEAQRQLRIADGLGTLAKQLGRWGWLFSRQEQTSCTLAQLAGAMGEEARARCAAAYFAYRLSATPALRGEADQRLPADYLQALDKCHWARRSGEGVPAETVARLAEQTELHARAAIDHDLVTAAWSAIGATWLARSASRLLGPKSLARAETGDRRRGRAKVEQALRYDRRLPASFRANPAQHFYALRHALAERRRQRWREACDREPDSFELAA
jgi:hypothetical protein